MPESLAFLVVVMPTSASLTEEQQISRSKKLVLRPLAQSYVLLQGVYIELDLVGFPDSNVLTAHVI